MNIVANLVLLGTIVLVLDSVFLYSTSSFVLPVYQRIQGMPVSMRYDSAVLCYTVIVCGIYYFIIREKKSIFDAFLLGLFAYGIYDLTVLSIFAKYPPTIAMMDMLWGGILFSTSTYLYRQAIQRM